MDVFCVATGVSGYEPISPADVAAIRETPDAELKLFMRGWADRNL
jgi:hypothetical protein